jgi:MoaE-MoaD fusion protein
MEHAAPRRGRSGFPSSSERRLTHNRMNAPLLDEQIFLTRDAIDAAALVRRVRAAEDGAVVTFDGCVRNHSHGRRTLYLDYEAYESMALAKMRDIAAEIHAKFAIHRVAIAHRLGRLQIGETSVFIAVSSPHRPAAFDACRFAIDMLKRTVPIWKKEYFEDGAVWADGELPPVPGEAHAAKPAS